MWNYKLTLKFRAKIKEHFVTYDITIIISLGIFAGIASKLVPTFSGFGQINVQQQQHKLHLHDYNLSYSIAKALR